MQKNKNIDRIFQENFRDFEVYPSNKVWKGIEKELKKSSEHKVLPLWQRITGVAVAFLLLFSLGYTYFRPVKKARPAVSDINFSGRTPVVADKQSGQPALTPVYKKNNAVTVKKEKKPALKTLKKDDAVFVGINRESAEFKKNTDQISDIASFKPADKTENKNPVAKKQSIFDQKDIRDLQEGVADVSVKPKATEKKWSVGANVSPVYMNSFTNGSALTADLSENATVTDEALSYGLKFDYRLNDKIRLQSGINKVGLSYNTKNVNAFVTTGKTLNNYIISENYGFRLAPSDGSRILSENEDLRSKAALSGDLNQSFDYLEIPFELKYNLYDSRVGFNLVGGISTFILIDNQVSIISPFTRNATYLGKANNINSMNFSGNFGLDIDYKISKDWFLNVSPMMKYQFNTFSENPGNFQPFYLGVYSGINYKF